MNIIVILDVENSILNLLNLYYENGWYKLHNYNLTMSRVIRKHAFLHIVKNKGTDQRLCLRYIDSTILLLSYM